MKIFWLWMVKKEYASEFNWKYRCAGYIGNNQYESMADIPKQMLIGYMLEYLFQKESYIVLENLTIDGGEDKSKKIDNIYNDLKQKIEKIK